LTDVGYSANITCLLQVLDDVVAMHHFSTLESKKMKKAQKNIHPGADDFVAYPHNPGKGLLQGLILHVGHYLHQMELCGSSGVPFCPCGRPGGCWQMC
jgi:hypothetical protein